MKIKCPGCGAILNIPESAAGKIVKCQCGKQLRAPGGVSPVASTAVASKPAASTQGAPRQAAAPAQKRPTPQRPTPQRPTPQRPTPQRPTPQRPTPQRPPAQRPAAQPAPSGGFGDDLFDELTDTDLKPVAAVSRPGTKQTVDNTRGQKLLKQFAGEVEEKKLEPGKRPGTMTFLGVINSIGAIVSVLGVALIMGLAAMLGVDKDMLLTVADQTAMWVIMLVMLIAVSVQIATAVSCFVPRWICWQIVLYAYGYAVTDRITGIVLAFQVDDGAGPIVKAFIYTLASLFFFSYLHGEEARTFYKVGDLTVKKVIVADILGLLTGLGLGLLFVFG